MAIRLATMNDFAQIMQNYDIMTDFPGQVDSGAGWVKGIYPDNEMIETAIKADQYNVYESEGRINGGMIVNELSTEGYERASWQVEARQGEFLSIHALGVMPDARGKGIAKKLVNHAISFAEDNNYKAIRIDVYGVNEAGKKLYPSIGFKLVDTIELYYEDTGLAEYLMYEYVI